MIIRTVRMTFIEDKVEEFIHIFKTAHHHIEAFPGCKGVDLCKDVEQPEILITISIWDSLDSLDHYRNSELFKTTWSRTKVLFSDRPEAWSLEKIL